MIAAARAEGWAQLPDVKVAYCPMVNRSWLQTGDKSGTVLRVEDAGV